MDLGASLRIDHELLAVERESVVHCLLELTAPPAPEDDRRTPLRLALVLDRSGSMAGPKLETAKACAKYLAHRARPDDELSIVAYDDEVRLVHALAPVGGSTTPLESAIAAIFPGGQTNLSGGWLKGVEQLRGAAQDATPKKVLLLSDGLANVGITDRAELAGLAKGALEEGVGTTTIGFGEGFDEELMTAMADAGSGNAYLAEGVDEVAGIFAQEFEGLVSLVAQNLSVEIRPGPDVSVVQVLNDFVTVGVAGGLQIQIGDAYGEERRRIVFALQIPRLETLGPATVADIVVRYVSVGAQVAAHELHVPVVANLVSADEADGTAPNADVVEEVVILKGARAQEEARRLALEGKFDEAGKLMLDAAEELRSHAPGSQRADELLAQADEIDGHGQAVSLGAFDPMLSKSMHYSSWRTSHGRPKKEPPS
jgi:Ca-activated chloride channel family protein